MWLDDLIADEVRRLPAQRCLFAQNIEPAPPTMPAIECLEQRRSVDESAARGVDDEHTASGIRERLAIENLKSVAG
jgi:hypothetical protein